MALAMFFHDAALQAGHDITPAEDTAKHIVQVLRMQPGDRLLLTNGRGDRAEVVIAVAEKKKCLLSVERLEHIASRKTKLHLAVAFTKNTSRNEWLLEKITELGVETIIPLHSTRSEKEKFRFDRWNNILISAMLQSQQCYLPELKESMSLQQVLQHYNVAQKLVAHCIAEHQRHSFHETLTPGKETLILIGPEGDFSEDEVNWCEAADCRGVSMGVNRLRTETAAMTACAYFNMVNNEAV